MRTRLVCSISLHPSVRVSRSIANRTYDAWAMCDRRWAMWHDGFLIFVSRFVVLAGGSAHLMRIVCSWCLPGSAICVFARCCLSSYHCVHRGAAFDLELCQHEPSVCLSLCLFVCLCVWWCMRIVVCMCMMSSVSQGVHASSPRLCRTWLRRHPRGCARLVDRAFREERLERPLLGSVVG